MSLVVLTGNVQDLVLSGPIMAGLAVAVLAGLISFFSPCCLPLVPVYLGYVSGLANDEPRGSGRWLGTPRVVAGTVLFVLGFSVVFTAYGAAFGALGRQLVQYQELLVRISGAMTIAMGLLFLGVFARFPALSRSFVPAFKPDLGLAGAPVLGGLFAIGWTPCIGPTLAAVLSLSTTSATAGRGALLTFTYSLGLGLPFLVAALSFGRATQAFGWVRRRRVLVTRLGGFFLAGLGLVQLSGMWSVGMARLQGFIVGWQMPL